MGAGRGLLVKLSVLETTHTRCDDLVVEPRDMGAILAAAAVSLTMTSNGDTRSSREWQMDVLAHNPVLEGPDEL